MTVLLGSTLPAPSSAPPALPSAQTPLPDHRIDPDHWRQRPPAPAWLATALKGAPRAVDPRRTDCLLEMDLSELVKESKVAIGEVPRRITVPAGMMFGAGCACYEELSVLGQLVLAHPVDKLPGADPWPPVELGGLTVTGYFTGRRIDSHDWFAIRNRAPEPAESADYDAKHPEFVVEGWCYQPPRRSSTDEDGPGGMSELNAGAIKEMKARGIPFCVGQSRCAPPTPPKSLPTGSCSRELILRKARARDSVQLVEEWDAAEQRYKAQTGPTRAPADHVSVSLFGKADVTVVAQRHKAKAPDRVSGETWAFEFETRDAAIDAMPALLCDPDVQWASIAWSSK